MTRDRCRQGGRIPRRSCGQAGDASDGPGARLALLRADMALRWETGEKVGASGISSATPTWAKTRSLP